MLSITVNTLIDENDGIGVGGVSFRDAIAFASTQAGTDTIVFDSALNGGTIQLTHGELTIDSNVTIQGPGANQLTVDAEGNSRVLNLLWGTSANISGVEITGGGNVDVGAGVYSCGADLRLENVVIAGNHTRGLTSSPNDNAGGIYSLNGSLHLINSTVDQNQARWNGGVAFRADDAGDVLEVFGSTISNNIARDQSGSGATGGIGITSSSVDAHLSVINSTLSANVATSRAAMYVGENAHLTITNSTISDNRADSDVGGIFLAHENTRVYLYNSILAGNVDTVWDGWNRDIGLWLGSFDSTSSNNIIGVPSFATFNTSTNYLGTVSNPRNPGLAPLGDYGGPTRTHALKVGSPALDAGNDNLALDAAGILLTVDQRGHRRPFDLPDVVNSGTGCVDIGAFEAGNPAPLYVKTTDDELDDIHAPNFDLGDLSLREALAIAKENAGSYEIHLEALRGGKIYISSEIEIEKDDSTQIEIIGPSDYDDFTISAYFAQGSRVLHTNPGSHVTISGMTMKLSLP